MEDKESQVLLLVRCWDGPFYIFRGRETTYIICVMLARRTREQRRETGPRTTRGQDLCPTEETVRRGDENDKKETLTVPSRYYFNVFSWSP